MGKFDLGKFLTENKLTTASKRVHEEEWDKESEIGNQIPKPEGDREVIGLPNNVEEGYEWLADFVYENPRYYIQDLYISRWDGGDYEHWFENLDTTTVKNYVEATNNALGGDNSGYQSFKGRNNGVEFAVAGYESSLRIKNYQDPDDTRKVQFQTRSRGPETIR